MASRNYAPARSLMRGVTRIQGVLTGTGASAPTITAALGVTSVARTALGRYLITFTGQYRRLLDFRANVMPGITGTNAGTNGINISRAFVDSRPPNAPRFVIEFPSTVGRVYTILYRDSLTSPWKVATPSVTAGANRTQWYDDGPPKTDGPPLNNTSRYYRVIEAPVNQ